MNLNINSSNLHKISFSKPVESIPQPRSALYDTPIFDALADYIKDQLIENAFDEMFISDQVDAILDRFTVSDAGVYKWSWASADEIESDLIEMMDTRKQLSSEIPDYEPDTPDRVLYTTAMILLSDTHHDDPRIEKIRETLKSNAIPESAFDEYEAKKEALENMNTT